MTAEQRWQEGRREAWRRPEQGVFSPAGFEVAPIAEEAAKVFVLERHYSGTFPAAKLCYGLIDTRSGLPELAGVAVLSVPASKGVLKNVLPGLEPYVESIELGRFVLAEHVRFNGETWFLGQVLRQAAIAGIRGVVSFSDPMPRSDADGNVYKPGHIGTIYKAANATYTGRGTERTLIILPDGSVFSARAAQKIRAQDQGADYAMRQLARFRGAKELQAGEDPREWMGRTLDDIGAGRVRHRGNLRYVFRCGTTRAQRNAVRIALPALPYPTAAGLAA